MADPRIRVRCYGGLLGDCFLIRVPRAGMADLSMLIDFGVLQNMRDGEARLPSIADDIRRETGGHLDIVVITHRHWDHVCGFGKAPQFADSIGELWMSWVENPDDAQGKRIAGHLDSAEAALAAFADTTRAALGAGEACAELLAVEDALSFTGSGKRGPLTTVGAIEAVRAKVATRQYFEPGQSIAIPGTGVKAYVLGPPRDEGRLGSQDPSADKHEVYPLAAALATNGCPEMEAAPFDLGRGRPFPPASGSADEDDAWLAARYDGEPWRRVDALGAEALALNFDTIVNNTSLVLAFELEPDGDVLLFAADAQVGNWLSWREIAWPHGVDAGETEALLARTVFYKVGHHGSINATAREGGLEAMTSGRLSAFIPVVETFARAKKPRPWDMPHGAMRERLEEMTEGRVMRGDAPLPDAVNKRTDCGMVTLAGVPENPGATFYIDYAI